MNIICLHKNVFDEISVNKEGTSYKMKWVYICGLKNEQNGSENVTEVEYID